MWDFCLQIFMFVIKLRLVSIYQRFRYTHVTVLLEKCLFYFISSEKSFNEFISNAVDVYHTNRFPLCVDSLRLTALMLSFLYFPSDSALNFLQTFCFCFIISELNKFQL